MRGQLESNFDRRNRLVEERNVLLADITKDFKKVASEFGENPSLEKLRLLDQYDLEIAELEAKIH